jgi:pimeloyl-ACP methyl ester carboxylesterase
VDTFVAQLGITNYALYLQDYGGPIGFRLAVAHPERVTALIIQNAVIHLEGLSEAWTIRKAFWENRAAYEEKLRQALLSLDVARLRHTAGVPAPDQIDPDTWTDEFAFLSRPGMDRIQLELMFDYRRNVESYPRWQAYLRERHPPTLVVWGKYDPLFTVAGAMAFRREVPDAEIHLLNASHFALDEQVNAVAALMDRFLARLHQIKEREAGNNVPDHASQSALSEQQMQHERDETLKRGEAQLPSTPPKKPDAPEPTKKSEK